MRTQLLIILISCFTMQNAQAAIIIKHTTSAVDIKSTKQSGINWFSHTRSTAYGFIAKLLLHKPRDHYYQKQWKNGSYHKITGWPGITSAVCSGLGVILILLAFCGVIGSFSLAFIPLFLFGIMFGIVGVTRYHKYKGLALAGLILGFVGSLFTALLMAIAVSAAFVG